MNIGSIVRFNDERFFEGAVQLGWLEKRPEHANRAAESFVFHGPRYHGANDASTDGVDIHYKLKDTASFVQDLLGSILHSNQGYESNPYWLVVAGYGSGKSHLALTCASLLSSPRSETASRVLQQLSLADEEIGSNIEKQLNALDKPALVLPLDGMSGFHLGNALSQAVFKQLALLNIDAEPLRSLSPRFNVACKFVERNYHVRQDRFNQIIPLYNEEELCRLLKENDETVYEAVDSIYTEANGQPIPIEGQESAQEMIDTLCHLYCGEDGPFSQIVIMFDEFGRYLEYAADKPHLAGDVALQQIFQGIQDNSTKIRFVGFIQYELKTYLKRFGGAGLRQLQRYITRFDAAEKWYLSTNLETIFAHMIHKDESVLDTVLLETKAEQHFAQTHRNLSMCLPSFSRFPVWQDSERFAEVIGRGCWPLHPMAVWFLTRQKDVVQSRSALTFIKDTISRISQENIIENGVIKQVSAADLVLSSMLSELVAAEREVGGTVAETLQTLLEKYSSHLSRADQLVLAGGAALEKMRIGKQNQEMANAMLREATALTEKQIFLSLNTLSELGALEWNRDLGQYELLTDGASRGQFQQWLRKQQSNLESDDGRNLFMRRASSEDVLANIDTDFGLANNISTPDWFFEATFAHSGNLSNCLKLAFKEWDEAYLPTDAKGKVIYFYIDSEDDRFLLEQEIKQTFNEQLIRYQVDKAPIFIVGLDDSDRVLIDNLRKLYLFDEVLNDGDKERFRRFIPDEIQRSQLSVKTVLTQCIRKCDYWVAGFEAVPKDRLKKIGNMIFSTIYTRCLPFEFDGFANKNSGGNSDSAILMKGLITKQVDGNWVQSQLVRLRNRINSLMAQSWGCLTSDGKLIAPRLPKVLQVFNQLLSAHKEDSTRSLDVSYQTLIRPPYGMNSASAGILISMLVGLDLPPRRLEYKNSLIASKEWLDCVFPKKDHQLNKLALKSTSFRFLSETSESRWRELLDRWDFVNAYAEQLLLVDEMKNLNKVDPVPEMLEGVYLHWLSEGKTVEEKVAGKRAELNRIEKDLERQAKRISVGHLLTIARKLYQLYDGLKCSGLWPESLVSECGDLLIVSRSLFVEELSDWIPRQTCKSVANLSEFRNEMSGYTRSLEVLGYLKQAETLRKQATSSIHRVEKIQEFQLTISQCVDYPRQPAPTASTVVRVLRDDYARGDELIVTLKGALGTFTEDEINAHISAIIARQRLLKKAESEKRNELGALYTAPISEQELYDMLYRARHLQKVFVGTRDEQEVSDIIYQLSYILNDIQSWPVDDISASRLDELLNVQISEQSNNFLTHLEEKDIEQAWFGDIYQVIATERIKKAYLRSKEWTSSRYLEKDQVTQLDFQCALEVQRDIEAMPNYLAYDERDKLEKLLNTIKEHCRMLEVIRCRNEVSAWLSEFIDMNIETLSENEISQYLSKLGKPPHELEESDWEVACAVEKRLQSKLDRMSVDHILTRILELPIASQQEIIQALKVNLAIN
ncbi:hypothetical protein [Photobacterium kishitanii]|uniref:hypothetical protein n=1 Tax=Photobacterium kishitanii TaxID=318456 RepID=UPI000D1664F5|nr:hypothetical protein [Photobacterium kishitanii]PSU20071.1 hypothetical protein CTM84_13850 [Photobacterium kishitanii]